MASRDWPTFNAAIVEEFRSNGGRVERFGGLPVIIVHTIGALSGLPRPTPLIPVFDGDQMMIYATAEGSPKHPAWYFNLIAHPQVEVETADKTFVANITEMPQAEADERLRVAAESNSTLARYLESAAPRRVPIFRVDRA